MISKTESTNKSNFAEIINRLGVMILKWQFFIVFFFWAKNKKIERSCKQKNLSKLQDRQKEIFCVTSKLVHNVGVCPFLKMQIDLFLASSFLFEFVEHLFFLITLHFNVILMKLQGIDLFLYVLIFVWLFSFTTPFVV